MIVSVRPQGTDNHRDVLVGVPCADVVDVLSQRLIELWCVKALCGLHEFGAVGLVADHPGQP